MTRSRPARVPTWRLVGRLIATQPGQTVLVAAVCAIAAAAGIVAHEATRRDFAALQTSAERRYGSLSVVAEAHEPDPPLAPLYPVIADRSRLGGDEVGVPSRPTLWITRTVEDAAREIAGSIGLQLHRRIEAAAVAADGSVRRLIAAGPNDPALASGDPPTGEAGAAGGLRVALRRVEGEPVTWHELAPDAVLRVDSDGTVWVRLNRLEAIVVPESYTDLGSTPVATHLVAWTPGGNAFAVAYDLSQLLAEDGNALAARAWPELVGVRRYSGAGGGVGVIRPLALLVAAIAVTGAVAVAARNRVRDVVLLRTIGMDTARIRGLFARETAVASVVAALIVTGAVLVFRAIGADVGFDTTVRRTLAGTAILPPLVAFLTLRRVLGSPLARIRREADL